MVKFPVKVEVQSTAGNGISAAWTSQANVLAPIPIAIPPEFMGPGGGYSPEDLYGLALLNCLIAIFKVYSEKTQLTFEQVRGRCIVTVDKQVAENQTMISHAEVFVDVTGASDREKVRRVLESSIKDCIVSNSIKSGKTFHITVN